jgi:glycine dehydrogenase subunit 2
MELIFEISKPERTGYSLPTCDVPQRRIQATYCRTSSIDLPEVSEPQIIRHFVNLSVLNHHVDKNFYPLGSCTMKYNPKINEEVARLGGFTEIHPLQQAHTIQGALQVMYELGEYLKTIVNLDAITLQPAAGAQGEFTAISMFKAYFNKKREDRKYIDITKLKELMTSEVAGIMLTNPNTLGLFEKSVKEINALIHEKGGLIYLDGANLNALLGIVRVGDLGFDAVHFNLHKTFSTPHGGGGPGAGPVAVKKILAPFLPIPIIVKKDEIYHLDYNLPDSIGKVQTYYGNFLVMVRAYTFLRSSGEQGLKKISKSAILNANYIIQSLKDDYYLPYPGFCMHEGVLSGRDLRDHGVRTLDVAKRLLDFGFHAPTVYFPLIVSEALMIEPTESETKETLDRFIDRMKQIRKESREDPDILKSAPTKTPVRRLDEVKAIKELTVRWKK